MWLYLHIGWGMMLGKKNLREKIEKEKRKGIGWRGVGWGQWGQLGSKVWELTPVSHWVKIKNGKIRKSQNSYLLFLLLCEWAKWIFLILPPIVLFVLKILPKQSSFNFQTDVPGTYPLLGKTLPLLIPLVAQTVKHLPAMRETQIRFLGREDSLEKEMAILLQHSCLENPMDAGAWKATVHGVTKSRTRLSDFTFTFTSYFT